MALSANDIEDLLDDVKKAEIELPENITKYLCILKTDSIVKDCKKTKVPSMCIYHRL